MVELMESANSASEEQQTTVDEFSTDQSELNDEWLSDRFESLLPRIQEKWPEMAKQTLEATQGSLDELIKVISIHSGKTSYGVKEQLEELFNSASNKTKDFAESLEPLEKQLEELLDDLNSNLRPRIETPIRKKPLLAMGIAAGIGLLLGIALNSGRK